MILLTTNEAHYIKYQDGYYDPANYTVGSFFDDMLAVFDKVVFVARCREVTQKPDCMRVDNDRIEFYPIRDFCGYSGFLSQAIAFWESRKTITLADRYLLQGPGFMASMIACWLRKKGRPYYVHIVGDPEDVAKAKTFALNPFVSSLISTHYKKKFKKFVGSSMGALSVTQDYFKNKYPSGVPQNDLGVSDVRLPEDIFTKRMRKFDGHPFHLIIVGVLLSYKGHEILLKALSKISSQCVWQLDIVGEGAQKSALKELAEYLGIAQRVHFCGRIKWGKELFQKLEQSDLFVLSSLVEGMPRVLLEAMTQSLPVVATNVGGVSEVLPLSVLVLPGDVDGLAQKISDVWQNPVLLEQLSGQNFIRIQDFRLSRLSQLRRKWLKWLYCYGDEKNTLTWQEYSECSESSCSSNNSSVAEEN